MTTPSRTSASTFQKGVQHLSGADALRVVRFRHNNDGTGYGSEDMGRMETQQKFLKAVAKQTLHRQPYPDQNRRITPKFSDQYVDTDLTVGNLAWLGTGGLLPMGADNIEFSTLPNEWKYPVHLSGSYARPLTLVNTYLNPYVEDRTAEDLHLPVLTSGKE